MMQSVTKSVKLQVIVLHFRSNIVMLTSHVIPIEVDLILMEMVAQIPSVTLCLRVGLYYYNKFSYYSCFPCITLPETALIFFSLIKGARDDFEVGNDSSDSVQIIRTPKTFEKNATLEDLIRATLSDVKFSDFLKQKGM